MTASPSEAEVNTPITVSVKVTSGGKNVPDNTSVTFSLTGCVPTGATTPHFENGTCEMVRTTSAGVATAVVVSSVDGTFELVARVSGVNAKMLLKFYQPVNPRALAIYSVTPNRGRPEGGEQVVIRGRGFASPLAVDFIVSGAARHAQVLSVLADGSQMTVVTPASQVDASAEQTADVKVTAGVGTASEVSDTLTAGFTFEKQFSEPRIYALDPAFGSYKGGEQVTIYGTSFFAPLKVTFGAEDAQVVSVSPDFARIVVLTPVHTSATINADLPVDVTVYTNYQTAQQQTATRAQGFTYLADFGKPLLYSVSPNRGSARGGETVTIHGGNLQGASVTFNLLAPLSVSRQATVTSISTDGTILTLVTPQASPDPVTQEVQTDIVITTPAGSSTFAKAFTYESESDLAIYAITPNRGRPEGGESVTIAGRGFINPVTVNFITGGTTHSALVTNVSADGMQITLLTPAEDSTVTDETVADVQVTVATGTSNQKTVTFSKGFTYEKRYGAPQIYSIEPPSGSYYGGEQVLIYGTNFFPPVKVMFGAEDAQVVTVSSDHTKITILTPRHNTTLNQQQTVDVIVYTGFETTTQQSVTRQGGFTYLPDFGVPILYAVTPDRGSPRGGETVTLTGRNLQGATATFVIGSPINVSREATVISISADGTSLVLTTPEASPDPVTTDVPVTIKLTTPAGSSSYNNAFTYVGEARPPIIYYLDPDRGSARGGDTVTVYGRFFLSPITVTFAPGGSAQVTEVASDGTYVKVITPAVQLQPLGQDTPATVTVVTQYGTGRDATVSMGNAYLYLAEQPTPQLFSLTPNSGPLEGGTRVTIFGTGFQTPVQVVFGDHQAQVVASNFTQVICIAPSITPTQPNTPTTVQVKVTNMLTGKASNTLDYRYGEAMFISAISPTEGPDIGGTSVTIFGQGFVAPVAVDIAGTAATVLTVSGTEIVVRTNPPGQRTCASQSGPVKVTNIDSNVSATGPVFTYRPARPLLVQALISLDGGVPSGNTFSQHDSNPTAVTSCQNTPDYSRYTVHIYGENFEKYPNTNNSAMIVSFDNPPLEVVTTWVSANEITFQMPDLSKVKMDQAACVQGGVVGVRDIPTGLNLKVTNKNNTCTDSLNPAIIIEPCDLTCHVGAVQVSLSPATLSLGVGTTATMTVCLNAVQSTDTIVQITQSGSAGVIDFTYDDPTTVISPDYSHAAAIAVRILAGQPCATFTVNGLTGGGPIAVVATLPVNLGGATATAQVTVGQLGITLTPASLNLAIGGNGNLTIQLSSPAPAGGAQVTVTQSGAAGIVDFTQITPPNPNVTTFTYVIPQGSSTYTFQVNGLSAGGPITVTATLAPSLGGASASSSVFVGQYTVTLSPPSLLLSVGGSGNFTVTISAPAPVGGLIVTLTQTGPAGVISMPATVTIPAGLQTASFVVNGIAAGGPVIVTATLPAAVGGASASSTVTVQSYQVSLSPTSLTLAVGQTGNFNACLNAAALSNILVSLTQTGVAGVLDINGPGTADDNVTITTGNQCAPFTVLGLAQGGPVTITATLPPSLNAPPATATVNVTNIGLTASPTSLTIPIGGNATFILNLSIPAPAGGVTVTATPGNASIATVTLPVAPQFPAGSSVTLPFTVNGLNLGTTTIYAQLPASLGGATAQVTVNVVNALTISPASLTIPVGGSGTYTLTIAAAQAAIVNVDLLFSGSPAGAVTFPVNPVPIPIGQTTVTFNVTGVAAGSGTITATLPLTGLPAGLAGASASAAVTVTGSGISLVPTALTLYMGSTGTFIVNLANPAPTGGVAITFTSSNAAVVAAPAPVTILQGSTSSGAITLTGGQQGTATLTAQLPAAQGGGSATLAVTVLPYTLTVSPASLTIGTGDTQQFTVTMTPARNVGTTVTLASLNPAIASVGASVGIPAGTTTATVSVTGVAQGSTVINASLPNAIGGATAGVNVTVVPFTITLNPVTLNLPVGGTGTFTVTMSPTRTAATTVNLLSGNTGVATVAASTSIAAGASTSPLVTVTGAGVGSTTITATLPPAGGSATAALTVNVSAFTLTPVPTSLNVPVGGTNSFIVKLSSPAPAGATLTFTSGTPGVLTPPTTVTFVGGELATGALNVVGLALGNSTIFIGSTGLGGATAQVQVAVVNGLTIVPASLTVPVGGQGQLVLNMAYAQSGSTSVRIDWGGSGTNSISITDPGTATTYTTPPATVVIPANVMTMTFEVNGIAATVTPFTLVATLPNSLPVGLAGAQAQASINVTGSSSFATLTLNPAPFMWRLGQAATNAFTLGITPTQTTATTITMSTTNPLVISSAATETIAASASTQQFTPTIGPNTGTATVTAALPASLGGGTATSQATIFSADLSPASLTIPAGGTGTITFTLSNPLPVALPGVTLAISGAGTAGFTVPSPVTIPGGVTSFNVTVTATSPGTARIVTATMPASVGGGTLTTTPSIDVTALPITLTPNPMTVYVGSSATATITLGATVASNTTVTLSQAGPGSVSIPATVTIPSGSSTGTFTVTGAALGTPLVVSAALPAALNPTPATMNVTIADLPLTLTPAGPTTIYMGGLPLTMTATIGAVRNADTVVTLSQAGPGSVTIPATVTVPTGSTTATFTVTPLTVGGPLVISGDIPAAIAAPNPDATATVNIANMPITLSPASASIMAGGGQLVTATIPAPLAANAVVALSSATPGTVSVPATVTITAGSTTATFTAIGESVGGPTTITATMPAGLGGLTGTASYTVTPLTVAVQPTVLDLQSGTEVPITLTLGTTLAKSVTFALSSGTPTTVGIYSDPSGPSTIGSLTLGAGASSGSYRVRGLSPLLALVPVDVNVPVIYGGNPFAAEATTQVRVIPLQILFVPNFVTILQNTDATVGIAIATLSGGPAFLVVPVTVTLTSAGNVPGNIFFNGTPTTPDDQVIIPDFLSGPPTATFTIHGVNPGGPYYITGTADAGVGGGTATMQAGVAPNLTLSGIVPNSGTANGGTPVAISGTFTPGGNYTVTFDPFGTPAFCTGITTTPISLTCTTTAHVAGQVDVQVTDNTFSQTQTLVGAYTYNATLTMTSVTSASASGSFVTSAPAGINCTAPTTGTPQCSAQFGTSPVTLNPTAVGLDTTWTWGGSCAACLAGASCSVTLNSPEPKSCTLSFTP